MAAQDVLEINLLPGEELEKAPFGKFLKWALSAGRYIVVVTELIVLLAFLSRFKLDRDLSDLSEILARQKSIIVASQAFENKIRNLQSRLASIVEITTKSLPPEKYLSLITNTTPTEAMVTQLKVTGNQVIISGTTGSEAGLATLVTTLAQDPKVKDLSVDSVAQNKDVGGLNFTVTATIWL